MTVSREMLRILKIQGVRKGEVFHLEEEKNKKRSVKKKSAWFFPFHDSEQELLLFRALELLLLFPRNNLAEGGDIPENRS